jgi:acyl-CoA thioesterase-1
MSRWWWSVAILLATACGPREQPDQALITKDSAPASQTILIIGTSLTAGLGLDPVHSYPARLQARIDSLRWDFKVINAGVSGETSSGALSRLDWLIDQQAAPAVVLLETGANDGLRGINPDSIAANLSAILTRLRMLQPPPVIIVAGMEALPNLGASYANRFRGVFPRAARDHGAIYLPFLLEGVAGNPRFNQADGIHPNAAGAELVADHVWGVLRGVLDSLQGTADDGR